MIEADYVVVGGGITGVCVTYYLANRGLDVILIERDEVGPVSPISSSGEHARAFRSAYGSNRRMTQLCTESLALWKQFEVQCDVELFVPSRMLVFGAHESSTLRRWKNPANGRFAADSAYVMNGFGLPHRLLSKAEVVERYPQIAGNDTYDHAILDETAGFIHARKAVKAIGALARRAGASVLEYTAVEQCVRRGETVERLITSRGDVLPKKGVVFAAGYMNSGLVPELHDKTRVTEHQILYFRPPDPNAYLPSAFPIVVDVNTWRYVFPVHGPGLMKVVDDDKYDERRWVKEPHRLDACTDVESFRDDAREFLSSFVPQLVNSEEAGSNVCRYTNTVDGNYLIYKRGNSVVLSACSGHGFKNAPMTARLAVSLVEPINEKLSHSPSEFGYQYANPF